MTRSTLSISIVALGVALTGALHAASIEEMRQPDKDWGKGPVRWIMSEEEEKKFKSLRADEERAAFAAEFWAKRDPTPGTPGNEYEAIFWKRVEEAERAYKSQTTAGSLTDFGRVFLLLGPPSKAPETNTRKQVIWTYEPNEVTGIKEPLQLMFGGGSLSPLLLDRKTLERYVAGHPETRGIGWKLPPAPGAEDAVPEALARNPEEDLSPESRRQIAALEALIAKGSGPAAVPFETRCDFYAAVDGSTLTVVTVEAPREAAHGGGDTTLVPSARLVPAAAGGKPMNMTGALSFVPAPSGEAQSAGFVYQARRNVAPGRYTMAVMVEDTMLKGQAGTLVRQIDVPDFSAPQFDMSTVSLLAGFTRIEAGLGPDDEHQGAGPYVLGSFRLVPRAALSLTAADQLAFYYQVYDAASDPATGKPSLEISYAFFEKEAEAWKPFRKPIVKAQRAPVELYVIDLKDLLRPNHLLPADFRLEVQVKDLVGGKELKRDVPFTVR